ncbi:Exodeoxyribonuclease I subunit D [Butyrivibrio fibrisolvens DSM 3071]|uniref:Nuclease SbcCD subunit D n=1 Tax=Butyrivibrio fibrisolvens DSM 3071 TaxID=1121131 RepID=A0A1M6BM23_BUTFI|nr:exonuclease SbcCD subunit D [Butyrivibrio fibrisolvens]SHI49762.1 Exodeoxyribonuclease I subunit D [Butyrivibrio fibrisolvens DSM 3071]
MRLMHLSDLHLGIKVYEFDLYDDQKYMLDQLIDIAREKSVDGIMISGDIYDRQVPPAESVALFDSFLTKLSNLGFKVYIISGNHDSQERLSFGSRLMEGSGIYFGGTFDGTVPRIDLEDEFGPVHIFMLPFLKPTIVRAHMLPEKASFEENLEEVSDEEIKELIADNKDNIEETIEKNENQETEDKSKEKNNEKITGYQEAIDYVLDNCDVNENDRNIIMAHQFVTGASRSDSEEINVGGVDGISADSFAGFDYVALGHIHTPQIIGGKETVRYCGTMLKYSFSECSQDKSVPVITFKEKGNTEIELVPLKPQKDMREIKGTYLELTAKNNYADTNTQDYLHVTLTDEEDVPDALGRLRSIYPNIMKLDYDNLRTRSVYNNEIPDEVEKKSPLDLFDEFYNLQNGRSLNEEESSYVQSKIDELWEGGI